MDRKVDGETDGYKEEDNAYKKDREKDKHILYLLYHSPVDVKESNVLDISLYFFSD